MSVLIVSIDGFSWQMLRNTRLRLPTLRRLVAHGVHGPATSVFPSMTWPAHATMVTGSWPGRHGVVGNRYIPVGKRKSVHSWAVRRETLIGVPTIFDVAHRHRKSCAAIFWPGSVGDRSLRWNIPYVYGVAPRQAGSSAGLLQSLRRRGIWVDQVDDLLKTKRTLQADRLAVSIATELIRRERPNVLALHLDSPDAQTHQFGTTDPRVGRGLEAADALLAQVLTAYERAGLLAQTSVFVVGDHGSVDISHYYDVDVLLAKHGLVDPSNFSKGPLYSLNEGQSSRLYVVDGSRPGPLIRRAINVLSQAPQVERIYTPDQYWRLGLASSGVPKQRVGDAIVLFRPHIEGHSHIHLKKASLKLRAPRAMHGYLPTHPKLLAGFVAAGYRIRHKPRQLSFALTDLAPTALAVMGYRFSTTIDGRVRRDIIG